MSKHPSLELCFDDVRLAEICEHNLQVEAMLSDTKAPKIIAFKKNHHVNQQLTDKVRTEIRPHKLCKDFT